MSTAGTAAESGQMAFPREESLDHFARKFASVIKLPLVVWLKGDLGTGKTAFARGLIHALGYKGRVKSPTYGLLEQYQISSVQVLHMDLYRIGDPGELEYLGMTDLLDERTVLLIEWPEHGGNFLPEPDFIFRFAYAAQGRELCWSAITPQARAIGTQPFQT